ncbi:MAG: anaerobic ribonucleoside triphosphate reductase, partial [Planctomycetes bacterium]|nr:anaerobic ribonucleoside triphosphate reductase [Planctomycetota bacterium]
MSIVLPQHDLPSNSSRFMPARTIVKRDGRVVRYDEGKIAAAIEKAFTAAGMDTGRLSADLAAAVGAAMREKYGVGSYAIERIQDEVENVLMKAGHTDVAKRYILYRAQRTKVREANTSLMRVLQEITQADARKSDIKRDNANIDGNTAMGSMLQIGSTAAKSYNSAYLLSPKQAKAHEEGWIHIHDFDFYALTTTCCQIAVDKLFCGGFSTGHGHLREPQDIQSYAALACIAIQSNQNDQHGGQSIPNFDYALAKGVAKTYQRLFRENVTKCARFVAGGEQLSPQQLDEILRTVAAATGAVPTLRPNPDYLTALEAALPFAAGNGFIDDIRAMTEKETERRTYQAMEALVHN